VRYLYQSGYCSYLIKVGLGLGEDAKVSFPLFNLSLLGCQSFWETLLQNLQTFNTGKLPNNNNTTNNKTKLGETNLTLMQQIYVASFLSAKNKYF